MKLKTCSEYGTKIVNRWKYETKSRSGLKMLNGLRKVLKMNKVLEEWDEVKELLEECKELDELGIDAAVNVLTAVAPTLLYEKSVVALFIPG